SRAEGFESTARHLVRLSPRHDRADGHGPRVSGLYRRRGPLCRPRTLRPPPDYDRVALFRHAGAGAELFRPGRAGDEQFECDREPVLSALSRLRADPDAYSLNLRNGDRQPSRHYRGFLADAAGHSAWLGSTI